MKETEKKKPTHQSFAFKSCLGIFTLVVPVTQGSGQTSESCFMLLAVNYPPLFYSHCHPCLKL